MPFLKVLPEQEPEEEQIKYIEVSPIYKPDEIIIESAPPESEPESPEFVDEAIPEQEQEAPAHVDDSTPEQEPEPKPEEVAHIESITAATPEQPQAPESTQDNKPAPIDIVDESGKEQEQTPQEAAPIEPITPATPEQPQEPAPTKSDQLFCAI